MMCYHCYSLADSFHNNFELFSWTVPLACSTCNKQWATCSQCNSMRTHLTTSKQIKRHNTTFHKASTNLTPRKRGSFGKAVYHSSNNEDNTDDDNEFDSTQHYQTPTHDYILNDASVSQNVVLEFGRVQSQSFFQNERKSLGLATLVANAHFHDPEIASSINPQDLKSVSYTHLTLPTICSV